MATKRAPRKTACYGLISPIGDGGYYLRKVTVKHDRPGHAVYDMGRLVYQEVPGAQRVEVDGKKIHDLLDETPDADKGYQGILADGQSWLVQVLSLEDVRRLLRDLSIYETLGVTPGQIAEAEYTALYHDVPHQAARLTGRRVKAEGPMLTLDDDEDGVEAEWWVTEYAMPDGSTKEIRRKRKKR